MHWRTCLYGGIDLYQKMTYIGNDSCRKITLHIHNSITQLFYQPNYLREQIITTAQIPSLGRNNEIANQYVTVLSEIPYLSLNTLI